MECDEMKELIYDCLSGERGPEEESGLRLHLRECPACRDRYREIEAIVNGIRRMEATEPSAGACRKTLERIEGGGRFLPVFPIPRAAYAFAAVILIVVVSSAAYFLRHENKIGMEGKSSTIAHRQVTGADMEKLREEYLDEADLVLAMALDISRGTAPYTIEDVKKRIMKKDLLYHSSVIISSGGGDRRIIEETNAVLNGIMKIKAGDEGKEMQSVARSIKRSRLIDRIGEERYR